MSLEQSFLSRVGLRGEPTPQPGAVVAHGEARFTVLTPRLVRIEWAPGADFDDRPSFAFPTRRAALVAPFEVRREGDALTIDTGALQLRYSGAPGPLGPPSLEISFELGGATVRWRPGDPDAENLRGARRTLDGCRGEAALEPGLLSRAGWTLHDDSAAVRFDPEHGWVLPAAPGPRQDWYFFAYGHDFPAALAEYARFGGAVPMIPRWILGAWWSRYWAYSEQDLRGLVGDFMARLIPLDVLVIDMDWHLPNSWTGYTWNRELFPDPPAFLAWLREQGLRSTLNLHPAEGVQTFEEAHPAFLQHMGLETAEEGVPFEISNPAFVRGYFELLHHPLEEQGVDFWWMDWQQGRTSELPGLDPLPWLNHLHYHDMRRREGRRPVIFSRWGGLGNHRYPIGFSGDTYATWEALRFQPYFTATAANVLYGWWSHDIGGHFGVCAPELYARWTQAGAFSPILRLHSTKDESAERRPWAFPEPVFNAARRAFHLRYALLPYLYTLARVHADTALAPCRPLYYSWPDADAAYAAREQYMLGDQMLVAPIVHPADPDSGLAPADVWVPPGQWVERTTGELLEGPKWHRLVGDLDAIPQLMRAGAILPLADVAQRSHQQPPSQLKLTVFPGEGGELRIYEDAGEGEGYRDGQYEWTTVSMGAAAGGRELTLTVGAVEGRCAALPPERTVSVFFKDVRQPGSVAVAGSEHFTWIYHDGPEAGVLVELPATPKDRQVTVTIGADEPLSLLGEGRSAALRAADARRLLGPAASGIADADLLDAALASAGSGRLSAVARLGGPFARVYEYTTPEDAARQLGRLLIAAPRDGTPVAARGVWRLTNAAGTHEQPFDLGELGADTLLPSPFAWDGSTATTRWELELLLGWRGHSLAHRFTSQTLFPTVQAGRLLVRPIDQPLAVEELIDAADAPRAELPWEPWQLAPEGGEFQNLTERYNIPLIAHARKDRSADLVGYVAVTLRGPAARPIRIAYQSYRAPRLYFNGAPLAEEQHRGSDAFQLNPEWSRSAPVELRPGDNQLLLVSEHRGEDLAWRWFLHLMVMGEDGLPVPDVMVVPASPQA